MADLIDRLAGTDPTRPKIATHQFIARFRLYVLGELTRVQAAQNLDLQGDEVTDATAIADQVDVQTGVTNKLAYLFKVESIAMLLEDGDDTLIHNPDGTVNKALVRTKLGIS